MFHQILALKGTLKHHLGGSFTIRLNMINEVNKDIFTIELTAFSLEPFIFQISLSFLHSR